MHDQAVIRTYGNTDLPEGTPDRPLATFALFAYNQEKYIREAVEGAFSQTYSPLEIILSDDCSSDRTFEIIEEMAREYRGPHLVKVRRGGINLGVAPHFDHLMRLACGQYLVAAAGDDISHPTRTEKSVRVSSQHEGLGVIEVRCRNFSGNMAHRDSPSESVEDRIPKHRIMEIHGALSGSTTGFTGAGRAYRRDAYIKFPPLIEGCPEEDTPALFRCLYGGVGAIIEQELVYRRIHDQNLSSSASLARMNMSTMASQYLQDLDAALAIDLIDRVAHGKLQGEFGRYLFRKRCAIDMHNGFRGEIGLSDVLQSRYFTLREKFYLLRKGMRSRLRESS